jgi:rhodanese-related sulfurtransferase
MDGEISGPELEDLLGSDVEPLVVDIRSPAAFSREHVAGSVNVPFDRLSSEITRVADEDHVVTVCPHGKASRRAARLVASFDGFDGRVESLAPGLEGWDGPTDGERGTRGSGEDVEAPF